MARTRFTLSAENEDVVENVHEEITPEEEGELAGVDQEVDDAEEELAELEEEEDNVEAALDKIEEQEEKNEQIEEERPTEIQPEDVNASVASYLEACGMVFDTPYGRKYNSIDGYYTVSPISVESMYMSPIHAFTQSREQNKGFFRRALDKLKEIIKAIVRGVLKLLRVLQKKDADHIKAFKEILKRSDGYGTRDKLNLECAMALQPLWIYLAVNDGKMDGKELIEYLSIDILDCVTKNKKPSEKAADLPKAGPLFIEWDEYKGGSAKERDINTLVMDPKATGHGTTKKGWINRILSMLIGSYTLRGKLKDLGEVSRKLEEYRSKFGDAKNSDDEITQMPADFGKFEVKAGFCGYKNRVFLMFNSSKVEDFFLLELKLATPMNQNKQSDWSNKYLVGNAQNDSTFNGTGMVHNDDPVKGPPPAGELLIASQYINVLKKLEWNILNKSNFQAEVNNIIKAISQTTSTMRRFEDMTSKYEKESDALYGQEADESGLGDIRSAVSGANKTIKACLKDVPVVRNNAIADLKTALAKQLINHGTSS